MLVPLFLNLQAGLPTTPRTNTAGGILAPQPRRGRRHRIIEGRADGTIWNDIHGEAIAGIQTPLVGRAIGVMPAIAGNAIGSVIARHIATGHGEIESSLIGKSQGETIESLPFEVVMLALLTDD